jgi:hypothetical protein
MENIIGTMVAYWFTGSVCLPGAAVMVWLAWNVGRMVRSK